MKTKIVCYRVHVYCICFILGFTGSCAAQVNIIRPPQTVTVCRGSDVTISCGYRSATALPVTWIINGTSFTQQEVADSPLYQLNNPLSPMTHSLTVFSINHTTTFQCIVHSTPSTTSTLGTIYMTTLIITRPPQRMITVCRGNEVTIRCGYCDVTVLPVTWIINGTSLTQDEVLNNSLYRLNHLTTPDRLSLRVFSINGNTTFQCMVPSTPNTTSRLGRVIVAETPQIKITTIMGGFGYVYVKWFVTGNVHHDPTCSIADFKVTLSSMDNSTTVVVYSSISHNFTGLPDDTLFNATVVGTNVNGDNFTNLAFASVRTNVTKDTTTTHSTISISTIVSTTSQGTTVTTTATTSSTNPKTTIVSATRDSTTVSSTAVAVTSSSVATTVTKLEATTNNIIMSCIATTIGSNSANTTSNAMSGDSGISRTTVGVVVITFIVTFIITLTATAIITFIVTYRCVKKTFEKENNCHGSINPSPPEKVLYEQVIPSSNTITKNDVKLQTNPSYATSHKVDVNPVYESCK